MDEVKVIILAGGSGERMGGSDLPKQLYALVAGTRVLDLTLSAYNDMPEIDSITVVYNEQYKDIFQRMCGKYGKVGTLVAGGESRQQSVSKGLDRIDSKFVLIHDSARPIVRKKAVCECIAKLRAGSPAVHTAFGAYSTMVVVKDGQILSTIDRSEIAHLQCPVGFRTEYLKESLAYATSMGKQFKDEICMVRFANPECKIDIVEGHQTGFKITYPEDFDFLRTYLLMKRKENSND